MRLSAGLPHLSCEGYQNLMQDAWVSSYKQTDRSWPTGFRTTRLQQRDYSFRYSVFLQLQSWLCVGMFCKRTIICVSYMLIHILMSDYNDNENLDSDCDVPTTVELKQLQSSSGPLTLWVGTVWNAFGRPGILVTAASKHKIQGSYSKFGPYVNIPYRTLSQFIDQNKNCHLMKPRSHGGVPNI